MKSIWCGLLRSCSDNAASRWVCHCCTAEE